MLVIGLTGNAGSGKSTVAGIWKEERDAVLIDADEIGRSVVQPGSRVLAGLAASFGEEILLPDGSLDRRQMARIAFTDEAKQRLLNSIVHPEIIRRINGKLDEAVERGARAVVVDAALIFEFGFDRNVDTVVAVDAPREVKIQRMLAKGKMDRETVEKLLDLQMSPVELRARAESVLDNEGDLDSLRTKALELFDRLSAAD